MGKPRDPLYCSRRETRKGACTAMWWRVIQVFSFDMGYSALTVALGRKGKVVVVMVVPDPLIGHGRIIWRTSFAIYPCCVAPS